MNADWHNASINFALQNVSTVTTCDRLIAAIGQVIDPRTSALLVIDLQNDTVGEQGAFAADGAAAFAARHGVVEKVRRLVDAARAAAMPVVFVWMSTSPVTATRHGTRSSSRHRRGGRARPGHLGRRANRRARAAGGRRGRREQRMSAFNTTTLDTKLRGLGVTTIVVCGAWTNYAVEHTCRDGADHGYEVVLARDGTATISDEWQRAACSYALTKIADLRTVDELVAELRR